MFIMLIVFGVASESCSGETQVSTTVTKPTAPPTPTRTFNQLKVMAVRLSYDELFRNNEQHIGKLVHFRGKISQVVDVTDGTSGNWVLRVNVTESSYGFWDDTVWLEYSGARFLEGDIIEFAGEVVGLKSYSAVLGNKITIPEINALQIQLITKASDTIG